MFAFARAAPDTWRKLAKPLGGALLFRVISVFLVLVIIGCAPISDYQCLDSPNYTYAKVDPSPLGYKCRRARGLCERGFIQSEHTAEQCEANSRCEYVPGACYCPPEVQCICGGGSPGQCQTKGK